jgi:hypothetical protein
VKVDRSAVETELREVAERASLVAGEVALRADAAARALAGGPVRPPIARRRWPYAVLAAVLGAAAGAAAAVLAQRLAGTDAPDAQEPEELVAVVDRPGDPAV